MHVDAIFHFLHQTLLDPRISETSTTKIGKISTVAAILLSAAKREVVCRQACDLANKRRCLKDGSPKPHSDDRGYPAPVLFIWTLYMDGMPAPRHLLVKQPFEDHDLTMARKQGNLNNIPTELPDPKNLDLLAS